MMLTLYKIMKYLLHVYLFCEFYLFISSGELEQNFLSVSTSEPFFRSATILLNMDP